MACGGSNRAESRGRSFFAIKSQDFWLFWLFYIEGVTFFFNFFAISAKVWLFLPLFLSLVKRTINLVIFLFQIFKGFTLLPWQKVGRI
jgi:hypothetical protein